MNFQQYIKSMRASGKHAFTAAEAIADLGISSNALNCGMYKLKQKKEIVSPAKSFYVIVPPEYHAMGCLPAEELIPFLMKYVDVPYYVCGLSAAYYHGVSHQKPQIFQIMTNKRIKTIECGRVKIIFSYKKNWDPSQVIQKVVKTGYLQIASLELTVLDLFTHRKLSGGLNPAATVLAGMIEQIDSGRLLMLIKAVAENAWWQKLGYVLEKIADKISNSEPLEKILLSLRDFAKTKEFHWVTLAPELSTKAAHRR